MKKALIVDDRADNLYLLRALLQGRGCEVAEARNGVEALDLARRTPPDIAITDLLMPVMDGYTLLRQWKADATLKSIPIVVYTATYTDSQDEKPALDLGADAFIIKPAEPDVFLAQLDEVCTRAAQSRLGAAEPALTEEPAILRQYSEALVRRLEEKTRKLERANQELLEREAHLRASEEHFRSLIANASDLITVVDAQGVIRFQGPSSERILGIAPEKMMGLSVFDWIHPDDAQSVVASMQQTLAAPGQPVNAEFRFRHGDGSWRRLEAIGRCIVDPDGSPVIVVNSRDVTISRQVLEQFRQAQKMEAIGRFAGGVAHDFNNLLMGISGFAEVCKDDIPPDHPARAGLDEILNITERASALTRQLLAFARKQAVVPRVLNLNDAIAAMIKMLRRLIGENIDLSWKPSMDVGAVKIDPDQMDQILANLCVNARDAISGSGRVTIETRNVCLDEAYCKGHVTCSPGEYVMLAVSDDGCGMDAATLENIFEPFFTTKEENKGTGLGLATVYGIVKQNKGFIDVSSEPGKGSTFQIYLPRVTG
ncbi:MAG TPA: response regulator [Kiritimatiellia bacterium]|nr:response regulator [Kiritimatiellia bacterium]HRU70060.1 response regulator [Kiritimatiellia bacterium]